VPNFNFEEHPLSGARLTFPFTPLGKAGPKHHAVVLGVNEDDGELWIAELSRKFGYRLVSAMQWFVDNEKYLAGLQVTPNEGPRNNVDVARSAIDEVIANTEGNGKGKYHIVLNNCESFAQRHSTGKNELSPQVAKVFKTAGYVIAAGVLVLNKHVNQQKN